MSTQEQQPSRLRSRIALLAGASLLALGLLETGLRFTESSEQRELFTTFEHSDTSYRVDDKEAATASPNTGDTLAWYLPGGTGTTGSATVQINNLGLRDSHDYPTQKSPDCYRILVLGDSMTFGKGVPEPETWPAVFERGLAARYPSRCIEVLNSGMPNINFHIQNQHFARRWRQFAPDHVLAGFSVSNDSQEQQESEPHLLWWMQMSDRMPASKVSALVRRLYYLGFLRMERSLVEDVIPGYFEDTYPGWQQFSDSLLVLQRMAAQDRFALSFALIPAPLGYDSYPLRQQHERLRTFLEESRGISVIDLLDGLDGIDASKHWLHPSDGHFDAYVHRAMADYLLEAAPWDLWLGECPLGTVVQRDVTEHACRAASGRLEGPYARYQDGRLLERGEFRGGLRSGMWTVVEQAGPSSSEVGDEAEAVVHRGMFQEDLRSGPWVEFALRPGVAAESADSGPTGGDWLSTLLMPDQWNHVGQGSYALGQRAGRWSWLRAIESGAEELLELRCYSEEGGDLIWRWQAGRAGSFPSSGDDKARCAEGQDCSGAPAEGLRPSEEDCFDERDDDGDADIDCADSDCQADPACHHLSVPMPRGVGAGDADSARSEDSPEGKDSGGDADSGRSEDSPEGKDSGGDDAVAGGDGADDSSQEFSERRWAIIYSDRGPQAPADLPAIRATHARVHPCP